jgi:hypothetical protein
MGNKFKCGKFGKKQLLDKGKRFDEHQDNTSDFEEKGSYGHKSKHMKRGWGQGMAVMVTSMEISTNMTVAMATPATIPNMLFQKGGC